jgi:hypothetical protein
MHVPNINNEFTNGAKVKELSKLDLQLHASAKRANHKFGLKLHFDISFVV